MGKKRGTVTVLTNQQFRHDYDTYEADTPYDVSPELAAYFVGCGWATSDEVEGTTEPPPHAADLEVHDSTLGHSSEVK